MRLLALVAVCALLGACAGRPTQVNLVPPTVTRSQQPLDLELKTVTVVIADIPSQTGKVMINATCPPLGRDSIQTSVDKAGLFKDDAAKKVTISTLITRFEFNGVGFSNTVDVDATYSVIDRSNGNKIFEKSVSTTASNNAGKTFNASERLINLWNQATQENISIFISALQEKAASP
jgi:hypothetical protein